MKYYTIVYPDVTESGHEYDHWETLSEKEILDQSSMHRSSDIS